MARSQQSKRQRPKDLREVLEAKRAKRALSNSDFKIAPQREKALKVVSWLRTDSQLIRVEEPSTPFDLSSAASSSPLGSRFEIENSLGQKHSLVLVSTSADKMTELSIHVSKIEKMIEKIVACSLEKLMRSDKGKEQVVIEDEEAKDEFDKMEHIDDTWQDEYFFKKMSAKKAEFEPVGKRYSSLEIFADVIDFLAVESKKLEEEKEHKEEEKTPEKEGVKGPKTANEERKKEEQEEGKLPKKRGRKRRIKERKVSKKKRTPWLH
ncbi:hypothetical protein JCGZ_20318 [Jatropha curcas]|uniref:Uncharacterized protein n=1 Tax=Jatropha curcas TaxID=180498 RepID=A0A067K5L1_JATCU|nr:hypothetical protein JCGZ_20318 [Jatropha curcas]